MKKIFLLLILGFTFKSCDYINEPVPIAVSTVDTALCPVPLFPLMVPYHKKVLLEEFTGHTCGNCPEAANEIKSLSAKYGDSLIPVSIHWGVYATPGASPYTYDFRIPEGEIIHDFFKVYAYPGGMVNRADYDSVNLTHFKFYNDWNTAISKELNTAPEIGISIINDYKSTEGKLCIHVKSEFLTNLTGEYRLVVLLTEDSIVKPHKDYSATPQDVLDYIHRHVLRASVNGAWGIKIAEGNLSANTSVIRSYTYPLNSEWNVSKLHVVAYIYNTSTYKILQAEEQKVQ